MLRSYNCAIFYTGICLIVLSACTPRGSVTQSVSQAGLPPQGLNNKPLYQGSQASQMPQSNIASQQLSATMLPVVSQNNGAGVDYMATGSIAPQTKPMTQYNPVMTQVPKPQMQQQQPQQQAQTSYRVQTGDTIYSIGRKFNVHPGQIIARNRIANPNQLVVGQSFIVPVNGNYTASSAGQTPQVPKFPQSPATPSVNNNYTVQAGDTIYSIGRKFNIHPTYIMNKNPSINPNKLAPGQVLNVVSSNNSVKNTNPVQKNMPSNASNASNASNVASATQNNAKPIMGSAPKVDNLEKQILSNALTLPVQGAIKENKNLRGILISASDGDAVKASASGEVIYVGNLNNYGNMVLVRHDNGLVTNYARLKKTFVQKGQKVNKGDLIASAGTSKEFDTSDVLFEVRKGTQAVNPLDYIG